MSRHAGIEGDAFSHRTRKNGEVEISHHGKPVTILRNKAAAKFTARISGLEIPEAQLLMARATGNYKRGNERQFGSRRKQSRNKK